MSRLSAMNTLLQSQSVDATPETFASLGLTYGEDDSNWAAAFGTDGAYNCTNTDQTAYLSASCQRKFQSQIMPIIPDATWGLFVIFFSIGLADDSTKQSMVNNVTDYCSSDCGCQVDNWNKNFWTNYDHEDDNSILCIAIIQQLMQLFVINDRTGYPCAYSDFQSFIEPLDDVFEAYATDSEVILDCTNMTTCTSMYLEMTYNTISHYDLEDTDDGVAYSAYLEFIESLQAQIAEECPEVSNGGTCNMVEELQCPADGGSSGSGSDSVSGSGTSDAASMIGIWGALLMSIASLFASRFIV